MKQTILLFCSMSLLLSCTNTGDNTAKEKDSSSNMGEGKMADNETKMDYAYTIEHPDQWEWGSKDNSKMVLQSLKAWENGDFDAAVKNFSDTVQLNFDGFEGNLSRDSTKAMFTNERKNYKAVQILMEDFESVKSKDTKTEYVSLWYKQKIQDQKGNWDSLSVMDDVRIKDGKIAEIDEKVRHFPKKKM